MDKLVHNFMIWDMRENIVSQNLVVSLYTDLIKSTFIYGFHNCILRILKSMSVFWDKRFP